MIAKVLFYIISAQLLFFSVKVVTTKNMLHCVLSALVVFGATAALFFLLNAEFLGMVQILVCAGAVTIMILFVVMLTPTGPRYNIEWEGSPSFWYFVFSVVLGGMLGFVIVTIKWPIAHPVTLENVTKTLSTRLFVDYLLPFEVASILLLVALIGAVVLARKD